MTFEDFDKWQAELWAECVKMRDTKGREYSHEKDRFANFNRLANELGISNVTVGWVYLKKHLDSIASYVKDGKTYSTESIRGRIVDAIVYLTLIGGMIEEVCTRCGEKHYFVTEKCNDGILPDLPPELGISLSMYHVGQLVKTVSGKVGTVTKLLGKGYYAVRFDGIVKPCSEIALQAINKSDDKTL